MVVEAAPYVMREPCRWCQKDGILRMDGVLRHSNGQDTVYCLTCERHCYNAPRRETGKPQEKIRTRPGLKPGQRERIIELHGARCWLCGDSPSDDAVRLEIAHAISVSAGREAGISDDWLFSDANLFPACLECNRDMATRPLDVKMYIRLILHKLCRNGRPE